MDHMFDGIVLIYSVTAILLLLPTIALLAGVWKVFVKAGHPGWASLVPFYNFYILLKIADQPTWYVFLLFLPMANIVVILAALHGMAKNFGKDFTFTIGLIVFGFIFFPILGFGNAQYKNGDYEHSYDDLLDDRSMGIS